jgi:hypothetical protein
MDTHPRREVPPPWSLSPVWCFNEAPNLGEAALAYARVGLPVFPLEPEGKAPLVPRGVYAATCDPGIIRRWWQRYPDANIGVPTGTPSGCWVLDVDPRHGGLESLERLPRDALELARSPVHDPPLHATRIQLTGGGGVHLCYRLRTDLDVRFSNTVSFAGYPGLDVRVGGGYIVVAPSRHRSGGVYRWQNDLPLVPFPQLLVERWRAHRQRAFARPPRAGHAGPFCPSSSWSSEREADPAYWLRCALKYGVPGQRHNYASFLACHLIDSVGMTPEEAEPYLVTYAMQVPQGDDPFTIEEALECLRWAAMGRKRFGMH